MTPIAHRSYARPRGWRPGRRYYAVLLLVAAAAIAWSAYSHRYYAWVLGRAPPVDVVVFCDTSVLAASNLDVCVRYDKIALTPPARALGLYQHRPPEDVKVLYPVPARRWQLTPVSVRVFAVPWGPIARIDFVSGTNRFFVPVSDRVPVKNTLYVRCE